MNGTGRLLRPDTNPTGWHAAVMAVAAVIIAVASAKVQGGSITVSSSALMAAVSAVFALVSHQLVTPVKDPRDGNGQSLKTP